MHSNRFERLVYDAALLFPIFVFLTHTDRGRSLVAAAMKLFTP